MFRVLVVSVVYVSGLVDPNNPEPDETENEMRDQMEHQKAK